MVGVTFGKNNNVFDITIKYKKQTTNYNAYLDILDKPLYEETIKYGELLNAEMNKDEKDPSLLEDYSKQFQYCWRKLLSVHFGDDFDTLFKSIICDEIKIVLVEDGRFSINIIGMDSTYKKIANDAIVNAYVKQKKECVKNG